MVGTGRWPLLGELRQAARQRRGRSLQRDLSRALADLPLPEGEFTVEGLIANIERVRGRRIFLVPIDAWEPDVTTACGLRVWTPDASFLFFRPRPTEYQTRHIILHEIVHEWLEHGESLDTQESQEVLSAQLQAFLEQQGVGPLVQARTSSYANLQEQQAEVGASWVKYMAQTRYQEGEDPYGRLVMSLSRPMAPPLRFRG